MPSTTLTSAGGGMATRFILSLVAVVIVALLGFLAYRELKPEAGASPYSVVYLSNGELYVGRLSRFPKLRLTEAYLIQIVKQPADQEGGQSKSSFNLAPLTDVIWSPTAIYLNEENILYYGSLREDSGVAQAIKKGQ